MTLLSIGDTAIAVPKEVLMGVAYGLSITAGILVVFCIVMLWVVLKKK